MDKALTSDKPGDAAALFEPEGFWRDLVSLTWNIHTAEGSEAIAAMLNECAAKTQFSQWQIEEPPATTDGITEAWLTFETASGRGRSHVRLREGKAFTFLTTLVELKGFEEPEGYRRIKGVSHGFEEKRTTWLENREAEQKSLGYDKQPYVVIIGGGQGGIALGARLRMLNVPTIIIEKNERPGDSWRKRYKSLALHDPVWYDHLPYLPFPKHWPVFSPKDKIGDWLEMYTGIMELNYWGSTVCESAEFDKVTGDSVSYTHLTLPTKA